jgi:endonuclease/exonuclease/phosphatase family metal-dependent hydrolase
MVLLTYVAGIMLLGSYLMYYTPPKVLGKLASLSLVTPLVLLANVLILFYWLFRMNRFFWITFIILAIGFPSLMRLYQFTGDKVIKTDDLKIMSYNVRLFNKYEWTTEKDIPKNIAKFIKEKDPDILCLQDYSESADFKVDYPYQFVKLSDLNPHTGHAIFSKYPIVKSGSFDFEKTANNILYADVVIDKDTLRVYNVHLQSIRLNLDKEYFGQKDAQQLQLKISKAFQMQQDQVERLLDHQSRCDYPIIIAGDLNNTAFSWAYKKMKKGKQDAFVKAGAGFDGTYKYKLPLRIDFILADKQLKVNHFKTYKVSYSDHYPIMCRLDSRLKK